MPFATAVSEHPLATHAAGEVIGTVLEAVGEEPDVVVLFVTGPFAGAMEDIAHAVNELLSPHAFVATTAASVLGGGREIEESGAVVLFAASWGGRVRHGRRGVRTITFGSQHVGDGWQVSGSEDLDGQTGTLVLFAEPQSFPIELFLEELHRRNPDLVVMGGLASAPPTLTPNVLMADRERVEHGAVALLLPEGVPVRSVLSHGARPVGDARIVTAARDNLIETLAGQPALDWVLETADTVSPEDRSAMARALHVGIVVDERKLDYEPGDFLIRQVLGADRALGAVAVGTDVEVGTTIQLHVRDADAAFEDLRATLAGESPLGILAFTDIRRGAGFFGMSDQDAEVLDTHVDGHAVAGMFASGEIAPVGGRSYVHTGSVAMLLFDA